MMIRCPKLFIGHYIFKTGFSKRIIDKNGALLKFQKVRPFSIGAKYKLVDVIVEDHGLKNNLIKIDYVDQTICDDDNIWKVTTEINLESGMFKKDLYDERINPFILNLNNFPVYYFNDHFNTHYFTAADDDSALLIYELGEK